MDDKIEALCNALKELMSIVRIHSKNTDNDFAWAEMAQAREALTAFNSRVAESNGKQWDAALDVIQNGTVARYESVMLYRNDPITHAIATNLEQWKYDIKHKLLDVEASEDQGNIIPMRPWISVKATEPGEDAEKLCHQIYDILPISSALKLLDDGKLYALITADRERIKAEERKACADRAARFVLLKDCVDEGEGDYWTPADLRAAIMRTEVEG
jgi:hypothetical protein